MPKVLIVEDENTLREVYQRRLGAEGFTVIEARDGDEVNLALMTHDDLDLVVLDIRVPIVDGSALFDLVKLRYPHAKVVVSSVFPLDEQKKLVSGADAYFDKAHGPEKLLSEIRSLLPSA